MLTSARKTLPRRPIAPTASKLNFLVTCEGTERSLDVRRLSRYIFSIHVCLLLLMSAQLASIGPTELGKINCRLPKARSISSPVPRDIEQRYTLFALAINQRSRPFRYQTPRESNSFGRSALTWDLSLPSRKKKDGKKIEKSLSRSLVVEDQRENSIVEKLQEGSPLKTLPSGILLR
ncbi:hypothetical protein PUN28_018241 [Cardiocondyla obscurior]|uniref:Uncharacterized protein n=1 Tax=Cardiocondyla obscurior TaxID=286306 RepID=A0AAW2EI22_9HYME